MARTKPSKAKNGMKASMSPLEAVGFSLAGFTFWVLADSTIKLAGESRLPAYEIVAFLGSFMAAFLLICGLWRNEVRELWPRQPQRQFWRSCLDLGNNLFVVIALRHLPLSLFYILVFSAPIISALLAAMFLHERLEWQRSSAILAGFSGVVIAVEPFGSTKQGDWIGYGAALIVVACFASNMVWSRAMTQTERSDSLTFFSGLIMAIVGFGAMLWHAEPVTLRLLSLLFAMSLFCALGNVCFFVAVKHSTTSSVSQYHYTQLISGALIGYLVWHEKPTLFMLIGGALIIASAFYMAARARGSASSVLRG
jgi:drug/metabolite transporter (DMT)-like permease